MVQPTLSFKNCFNVCDFLTAHEYEQLNLKPQGRCTKYFFIIQILLTRSVCINNELGQRVFDVHRRPLCIMYTNVYKQTQYLAPPLYFRYPHGVFLLCSQTLWDRSLTFTNPRLRNSGLLARYPESKVSVRNTGKKCVCDVY